MYMGAYFDKYILKLQLDFGNNEQIAVVLMLSLTFGIGKVRISSYRLFYTFFSSLHPTRCCRSIYKWNINVSFIISSLTLQTL
jgi:hypothetical protein